MHIADATKRKPTIVEFAVALDKLCEREAQKLIHKSDDLFPSEGSPMMKATAEDTRSRLQQVGEHYVKTAKDRAVTLYSDMQAIWRKSNVGVR